MSGIDPTKPTTGTATTASVRDNFATTASELDTLTAALAALQSQADQRHRIAPLLALGLLDDATFQTQRLPLGAFMATANPQSAANTIWFYPFAFRVPVNLTAIAWWVSIASGATANARIYTDRQAGAFHHPDLPLAPDAPATVFSGTGWRGASLSQPLAADTVYWLAHHISAPTAVRSASNLQAYPLLWNFGLADNAGHAMLNTLATWPPAFPLDEMFATANTVPVVRLTAQHQ